MNRPSTMCKFCSVLLSQIHFDVTENTIAISFPSFVQPTSFVSHKDAIDYPFLFTCGEVCHNNNNKNKSIVFKFFRPLHYTFPIYQINSRYFFYSCSFQFPLSFIYPPPPFCYFMSMFTNTNELEFLCLISVYTRK